ncbi:DUF2851 family protein [Flavobacterium sp. H122]|uniref:DUF2851 family protein n=1 Tax=Flavobacterium sp. H122 TaxID=2529860 RepID=UPI0010AA2BE0|nr:DUF2851 family protein [Flavobacterium sp. H122]
MKEDFLHYVWQNKKFDFAHLKTTQGESLQIIHSGNYIQQTGPDFFNAQLIIENQKWAGNIEIHIKSSDWYLHHHEIDQNYDNVILHVVWENDISVLRKNNVEIPVLELKHCVSRDLVHQYQKLKTKKNWINCENDIAGIQQFVFKNWQERLFFERLERKSYPVLELLQENNNDWEVVLFCFLAKNFGLNVNGEIFFQLAKELPFSVVRKESFDVTYLEALFFGHANLLPQNAQDSYSKDLIDLYDYLSVKYKLEKKFLSSPEFFRLRPDNFPTIRLAQLAMLYHKHRNLFSKVFEAKTIEEFYKLFDISVSDYWQSHYNFEKKSTPKEKGLSKSFIDLLLINTILPIKMAYSKFLGTEIDERMIYLLEQLKPEKNAVIDKFKEIGVRVENSFESQSLLQLKNEYCSKNKCLQCAVGITLLKN